MLPPAAPSVNCSQSPQARLKSLLSAGLLLGGSVLFAFPSISQAQQQERKLMDRIDNPDMTLEYDVHKTARSKGFSGSRNARVREYYSPTRFRAKDFTTGAYSGSKQAWAGDFTYSTRTADTDGRGAARRMVREHRTRDARVRESRDANRSHRTAQHASANQTSRMRGKSQDKIDAHGPQAILSIPQDSGFTQLKSIDDIRDLLNKPQ